MAENYTEAGAQTSIDDTVGVLRTHVLYGVFERARRWPGHAIAAKVTVSGHHRAK
jgi:hypothetical protein